MGHTYFCLRRKRKNTSGQVTAHLRHMQPEAVLISVRETKKRQREKVRKSVCVRENIAQA